MVCILTSTQTVELGLAGLAPFVNDGCSAKESGKAKGDFANALSTPHCHLRGAGDADVALLQQDSLDQVWPIEDVCRRSTKGEKNSRAAKTGEVAQLAVLSSRQSSPSWKGGRALRLLTGSPSFFVPRMMRRNVSTALDNGQKCIRRGSVLEDGATSNFSYGPKEAKKGALRKPLAWRIYA